MFNAQVQQTSSLSEIRFMLPYNQTCVQLRNSSTAENSREQLKKPFSWCDSKCFLGFPGQRKTVAAKTSGGKAGKFVLRMLNTKAKALLRDGKE